MSRYQFNRDQLHFTEVRTGIKGFLKKGFIWLFVSLLLAVAYYAVFASFFNTPEEQALIREQRLMSKEYERLSEKMKDMDIVVDELEERDREIYRTVFQSVPQDIDRGRSTLELYEMLLSSNNVTLIEGTQQAYQKLGTKMAKIEAAIKSIAEDIDVEKRSAIPSVMPFEDVDINRVTTSIGDRIHPFYKTIRMHSGIDFVAALGTNVLATADGEVVDVVRSSQASGNVVKVRHALGYTTVYAHLNDILVREGQKVLRGAVLGRVGNSGMSLAPHLHYEVWKGEKLMNPVHFFYAQLRPQAYLQVVTTAYNSGQSLD